MPQGRGSDRGSPAGHTPKAIRFHAEKTSILGAGMRALTRRGAEALGGVRLQALEIDGAGLPRFSGEGAQRPSLRVGDEFCVGKFINVDASQLGEENGTFVPRSVFV